MKLLALDTATECCSAALLTDGQVLSREIELARGHAERILPMIDALLAEAQMSLRQLDALAFGRGPGSFTGVRLAASLTQGLALGAGLGVIAVSDLQALAQRVFDADGALARALVCSDARMHEVYWACFERGVDALAMARGPEGVGAPKGVRLPSGWTQTAGVGRGFMAYADLRNIDGVVVRAPWDTLLPRAAEVVRLAAPHLAAGRLLGPEEALPVYLRDDVARALP